MSVAHAAAAPVPHTLGSRGMRLAAQIIDGVLVGFPLGFLLGLSGVTGAPVVVLYVAVLALYAPLLMARSGDRNGQTIGKQAVGVRVVRTDGQPMTVGQGLLREVVGRVLLTMVTLGVYSLVDALWCLGDRRKQCLHDKVASTIVVSAA